MLTSIVARRLLASRAVVARSIGAVATTSRRSFGTDSITVSMMFDKAIKNACSTFVSRFRCFLSGKCDNDDDSDEGVVIRILTI